MGLRRKHRRLYGSSRQTIFSLTIGRIGRHEKEVPSRVNAALRELTELTS